MILPERHRRLFSDPMGELVAEPQVSRDYMLERIRDAPRIVTVGDRTTERMLSYGITPDVQIVDGLEKRQDRSLPLGLADAIRCSNPPAHITDEAVAAIIRAYGMDAPVCIRVDGEEDLLVLPALIHAPEGTLLMYGQPDRGLVLVRADAAAKNRAARMMEYMEGDDETVAV